MDHIVPCLLYIQKKSICVIISFIYFIASLEKAKSKLPKAMIKSDISCTEDENYNGIPKYDLKRSLFPKSKPSKKVKLNPENQHASTSSCPPQYSPVKGT